MKLRICLLLCAAIALAGCEYDNYEAPKSRLCGRIVYDDEPVGLRQTGTGQDFNLLELYQPGFEGTAPIPVYVAQDGVSRQCFSTGPTGWLPKTVPDRGLTAARNFGSMSGGTP